MRWRAPRHESASGNVGLPPCRPERPRGVPRHRCRNARATSDVRVSSSPPGILRRSPTMSFQAHPDTIEKKTGQPPRKVVAGYFLSLDGVAEAPDRFITP